MSAFKIVLIVSCIFPHCGTVRSRHIATLRFPPLSSQTTPPTQWPWWTPTRQVTWQPNCCHQLSGWLNTTPWSIHMGGYKTMTFLTRTNNGHVGMMNVFRKCSTHSLSTFACSPSFAIFLRDQSSVRCRPYLCEFGQCGLAHDEQRNRWRRPWFFFYLLTHPHVRWCPRREETHAWMSWLIWWQHGFLLSCLWQMTLKTCFSYTSWIFLAYPQISSQK